MFQGVNGMRPWVLYAGAATASLVPNGGRGGAWYFWILVGIGMKVGELVNRQYTLPAGLASAALTMSYYNYVHPFGRGPNPLKS